MFMFVVVVVVVGSEEGLISASRSASLGRASVSGCSCFIGSVLEGVGSAGSADMVAQVNVIVVLIVESRRRWERGRGARCWR